MGFRAVGSPSVTVMKRACAAASFIVAGIASLPTGSSADQASDMRRLEHDAGRSLVTRTAAGDLRSESLSRRSTHDTAVVVLRLRGCDYFLADGPNGLYLLEWYGGYDPERGDDLFGDINGYGFRDVFYITKRREGRVYVDDYMLSRSRAIEKLAEKCDELMRSE